MNKPIYSILLNKKFLAIVDGEECISVNLDKGEPVDTDFVDIGKIDVNQWYAYNQYNCVNKIDGTTIMCYNKENTEKCVETLNKLSLIQEREEAKKRAMAL